ncbi:hypothetical protein GCM10027342_32270 [Photobacterium alginatilyticum]|uniref:GNAT family N-acetyltransferase n=2 Tax=Photobacterium alginatilyticum TaxID=1775171 RepID=A0ABW9YGN2_9GAMM|nr:GNAT family N-acetyltransferase [Photobacterium alginatilyticum]
MLGGSDAMKSEHMVNTHLMDRLRFEKYSNQHFTSCVELIKSTWNFHIDFINIPDDNIVYEYYFKTCLNWNQHLDVVVDENSNVKGLLFASKEDSSVFRELVYLRKERQIKKWKNKKIRLGAFGDRDKAEQALESFVFNDDQGEIDAEYFDSEVNLFVVSPELKGMGLGRKLMDRYMRFCRENAIETAFLWTDMDCNYSFYHKYGFKLHRTFKCSNQANNSSEVENGMVFYIDVIK